MPCHEKISAKTFRILVNGLKSNDTSTTLDVHVEELGHRGVEAAGIQFLIDVLARNSRSKLCRLDVSEDEGPEIPEKMQAKLTKLLVRNAKDNNAGKFLISARKKVFSSLFRTA